MDTQRRPESAGDFLAGIALAMLSVLVIALSLSMPRPRGWHSAPGLVSLILGVALLTMSLALLVLGVKEGGVSQLLRGVQVLREGGRGLLFPWIRALGFLGGMGVYVFALLRWFPFEIATFLYLSGTLGVWWRRDPLRVVLVSAGVVVTLSLLFGKLLRTLLPGMGTLL